MFPIHNTKGKVIAFGGRAFDNKAKAKYLNSSESPIFSKSRELYGLYQARKYSRTMDYVLVVEGYMDVVALHQADFTKVVATLGTATTPEHLQILARTTNIIVFCFDGDNAGRAAAWKALQIALPIIKAGLVIKFLFLPDGEDPDTLVKKESTKAFEARIEKAHTLSKFLFDHVKAEVDFDTIEGKTLFLEKVSVLINQVNYEIYQQQLIDGVAQVVGQSVDQVQTIFKQQAEQVISTSFDTIPVIDNEPPMPDFSDFSDDYLAPNIAPQENSAVKALMSRMISLLLNHPSLAYENDTVEVRMRDLKKIDKKFDVLLDLVHSAEMVENISQEELLKPFKNKVGVYNRLQQLCTLVPYLSENEAKNEFLDALLKVEGQQKKTQSLLIKDEKEYAKNLQARRGKKD
jgi:DNA primase